MARAIIRYSFGTPDTDARKAIRDALDDADFERIGTGTFQGEGERRALIDALTEALAAADSAETLDHLWIYLDEPDEPDDPEPLG